MAMKAASPQILELIAPNEIYRSMEYLVKMFGGLYRQTKLLGQRADNLEKTVAQLQAENARLRDLIEKIISPGT